MSTRAVRLIALLALAAGLALVPVGQSRGASKQTLLVTFFPNATVSVSLPDGTPVGTTSGSPTVIPAGYYGLQLLGPGGCVQQPLFHLHGPGEDFVNDMNGGDATSEYFDAYFAPNSTYTWRTDNANIGVVDTFTTGPVVEGTRRRRSRPAAPAPASRPPRTSSARRSPAPRHADRQRERGGALSVVFNGKSLTHLAAGRYRIAVSDRSASKGFILQKKAHRPLAVTGSTYVGTPLADGRPDVGHLVVRAAGRQAVVLDRRRLKSGRDVQPARAGDEMDDRVALEGSARPLDQVVLDPVLLVLRVRHEHDLVGREDAEAVGDRLQRLGVSDRAGHLEAAARQALQREVEPPFGPAPGRIDVRDPEAQPRAEGRSHHEHLGAVRKQRAQLGAVDRLVRDDQDPERVCARSSVLQRIGTSCEDSL